MALPSEKTPLVGGTRGRSLYKDQSFAADHEELDKGIEKPRSATDESIDAGWLRPRERGVHSDSVWEQASPFFSEFAGSAIVTLTVLCNATSGDAQWFATSIAFIVSVLMYSLGHISGANLNPSITVSLWLANRLEFRIAIRYIASQIVGAVLAGLFFKTISDESPQVSPKAGYGTTEVFYVEVFYTAMIAFTYLNCVASTSNNPGPPRPRVGFGAMAIGFAYLASMHVAFDVSTAALNPAVTIGMTIVDFLDGKATGWWITFMIFEIIGSLLANTMYRVVRPDGNEQEIQTLDGNLEPLISAQIMAEFVGSFYMSFTRGMERLSGVREASWPVAGVFIAMNYSLATVSGPHLNPAVTLSVALSGVRTMSAMTIFTYILAQLLSSLVASAAAAGAQPGKIPESAYGDLSTGRLAENVAETVFCCLLCYASLIFAVHVLRRNDPSIRHDAAGLIIGGTFAVGGLAGGRIMNPTAAINYTLMELGRKGYLQVVVLDLLAAVAAALIWILTHKRKAEEAAASDGGDSPGRALSDATTVTATELPEEA